MNLTTTIWLVNLALEIALFWRLVRLRQLQSVLALFIGWLLLHDVVAFVVKPFVGSVAWSYIYWGSHAVTYVLLLFTFMPRTFKTLAATYWLLTLVVVTFLIMDVWIYAQHRQYLLALTCGVLTFSTALISCFSGTYLPRGAWAGVLMWSCGLIGAASPRFYNTAYPIFCAAALALFLVSTYASAPFYMKADRLPHVRLSLPNRFNRRMLAWR